MTRPAPEMLAKLLRVDPATGRLFWLPRTPDLYAVGSKHSPEHRCAKWNSRHAGTEAFTYRRKDGYAYGHVLNYTVAAHRVIIALTEGQWPDCVDHVNGDRADNRLANLRSVSRSENARNVACRNPSGAIGVYPYRDGKRWYATVHLGIFDTFEEARAAREEAQRSLGYHENHGRTAK